jgi:cysteine desulfurase
MMPPIYLDYNATTPVDPAVVEAMQPYISMHYGNPSSAHVYGRVLRSSMMEKSIRCLHSHNINL